MTPLVAPTTLVTCRTNKAAPVHCKGCFAGLGVDNMHVRHITHAGDASNTCKQATSSDAGAAACCSMTAQLLVDAHAAQHLVLSAPKGQAAARLSCCWLLADRNTVLHMLARACNCPVQHAGTCAIINRSALHVSCPHSHRM